MVEFARLFDPALVASIDDIGLRLADPSRLAAVPIVRPGVARHGGSALVALDLRAAASTLVPEAPCDGAVRRVALDPSTPLPDGTTEMLEIVPLPFPAGGFRPRSGMPTFYVAPFDQAPPDGERVARGAPLAATTMRAWIAARFQDSFKPAPHDWIRAIGAALPAAAQPAWLAQEGVYGAAERLRVTDHVGEGLEGAAFVIALRRDADLAVEEEWTRSVDARSDLALAVAAAPLVGASGTFASLYAPPAGRHFALRWVAAAGPRAITTGVLSFYPDGPSAPPGSPLAIAPGAPSRRSLQVLAVEDWFAARPAGASVPMFRTGSRVEPLVDGVAAFARLVDDLDDARRDSTASEPLGGHFTGLFVMDFPLVRGRDDTKLSAYAADIIAKGGSVLVLPDRIVNLRDEDVGALRSAAILLLFAVADIGLLVIMLESLATDERGAIFLFLAITGLALVLAELDLPLSTFEKSTEAMDRLNEGRPRPIAIFAPAPMRLDDNPLTPPSRLYGLESTVDQFGFWHVKAQVVKRAAAGEPESHVAHVGGVDINPNRLDTPAHQGRSPFHDVHARLSGPIAADVFASFGERWAVDAARNPVAPAPLVLTADADALAASPSRHIARIGRTYYGAKPGTTSPIADFAPAGERTIYETLLQAIRSARDHIYIEDQYFTPNDEYVDALVAAAARCRRLVVLIPTESDQIFGDRRRRMIIDRLRGNAAAPGWGDRFFIGCPLRRPVLDATDRITSAGRCVLLRAATTAEDAIFVAPPARVPDLPGWLVVDGELMLARSADNAEIDGRKAKRITVIRERAGSLELGTRARSHAAGAPVTFSRPRHIYVHSKCMMVDDMFVSIGSANVNRRGFFHDGELNVFAIPEALRSAPDNPARALRTALWAEQLGLPPAMGSILGDATGAFDLFLRSRFFTRALSYAAVDIRPQFAMPEEAVIPGSLMNAIKLQAGLVVPVTLESLLDEIWNMVVDPTSFTDPNPRSGPV
ncbi:MAG: hypothetical protein JNK67_24070 [Alphaproteobacteria bacterium]|nr:hypothetical protein [Alphaproteobacteria bacterium]